MMKLLHSPASPFVRKAVIAAHELGLTDQIEIIHGDYNDPDNMLFKVSPVGKLPALVAKDGRVFTSSQTICRFLDTQSDARALFPANDHAKFRVIENEALADALMDAAVDRMRNRRKADQDPSAAEEAKFKRRVTAILDAMEANPGWLSDKFFIDDIAWICALEYLDFRFGDEDWRQGRPSLTAWYDMHADRPSVVASRPSNA